MREVILGRGIPRMTGDAAGSIRWVKDLSPPRRQIVFQAMPDPARSAGCSGLSFLALGTPVGGLHLPAVIPPTCRDRVIAPSLLAADFSRVREEVTRAIHSGADWIHLDVMDGHFVDNISFGPAIVQAVHETNDIFLDVHLMVSRPDHFLPRFIAAGADLLTVHIEAEHDVAATLRAIRHAGCKAGLALNPATPFEAVVPHLEHIDLLLCMTVVPGFGGQAFMAEVLPKIEAAAKWRDERGLGYHIEVDGGIDALTAARCAKAGANVMVAGSSTFRAPDMALAVKEIREA